MGSNGTTVEPNIVDIPGPLIMWTLTNVLMINWSILLLLTSPKTRTTYNQGMFLVLKGVLIIGVPWYSLLLASTQAHGGKEVAIIAVVASSTL